jgi:predicted Zn-dependent protease
MQVDVNSLFSRAEQAFAAGRLDRARADILQVHRLAGDHPAVLHLLALVEKRSGNAAAADQAFKRAINLAPRDPQLLGNRANLLSELGESEAALALYDRALALDPGFRDARFNRALLLQRIGRTQEALEELDALASAAPPSAKVESARGGLLMQFGRLDEAGKAYDRALQAEPSRPAALYGRGRVSLERGDGGASDFYAWALQKRAGDLELILGLAEARTAEGDPTGVELLAQAVEQHPDWIAGHEVLARMRSEASPGSDFADHYPRSLKLRPNDRALHHSHWKSLALAERYAEALAALQESRRSIDDDEEMLLMEAVFMGETGDPLAALRLMDRLDDLPGLGFARGRAALRAGDAKQSASILERVTQTHPGAIGAWALLDIAWRLTGDSRHEWLSLQPNLYGAAQINLDRDELARLADVLRALHVTRSHPIGQSLRGGTQTRGRLFSRPDPEIARLERAVSEAVHAHFQNLPPTDESHPLLRHRDRPLAIQGAWSVRLTSQGFHVNHIHPEGILSSACYISLPPQMGSEATREGWLEIGAPPAELKLDLAPLASIKPEPGRLALFPSYLFHGTRPFKGGERLTAAFDVVAR